MIEYIISKASKLEALKKYKTEEDNYIRTGKHIKIIVLFVDIFLGMILCIKYRRLYKIIDFN